MSAEAAKSTPPSSSTPAAAVVTLASEDLAWAQAGAEREGKTVSVVVTEAVRQARQAEAWAEVLPVLLEGQPPITDEEMQATQLEWKGLTLDTGALIALERRQRRITVAVATAKRRGSPATVPSAVIVEWWRGQRGWLAQLLDGFEIEPLTSALAHVAGEALAAVSAGPSAVDAVVIASAAQRGDVVYTADLEDLERLRQHFPSVRLLRV